MTTERLAMHRIREILRLRWAQQYSVRETARSLGVSTGVVSRTSTRAQRAELSWAEVEPLDDHELEERLYGRRQPPGGVRPEPDPAWLDQELRKPGVTLELLHLEYLEQHPDGLRATRNTPVTTSGFQPGIGGSPREVFGQTRRTPFVPFAAIAGRISSWRSWTSCAEPSHLPFCTEEPPTARRKIRQNLRRPHPPHGFVLARHHAM